MSSLGRLGSLNRASSRPPRAFERKGSHQIPVSLDLQDWEESWTESEEPEASLDEIRQSIAGWEEELKSKGKIMSGRTIVVVHSLPYVCTLHPTSSHSTSFEGIAVSGTTTPLEIHPGDPLLRPRALHSPTTSRTNIRAPPILSFPAPGSSASPSLHPACPPSRAPSPQFGSPVVNQTPEDLNHRWVLHPRRGHAALNSGIKSLSSRELIVVGRPDDLERPDGNVLGQGELGEAEKKDLEQGLKAMNGSNEGEGIGCVPVWLDDKVHFNFYEGMCKTFLWPIFHYLALPDSLDKKSEAESWNAYYETNLVYAKKVAEVYQPGDLVWIHDYHLLLVPKMLKELLGAKASPYISLYLHCPFPSSEYFRCLPRREAILDGMLGCNLVCFQTHSYARHFLSSCVRVMGYEAGSGGVDAKGSITRIAHCPIGIDVANVESDSHTAGVGPKIEALKRLYDGKKIIVGRDKLDPTKGVLPKLRAFERFLHDYPQWAQKVVLIQVTSPSSGDSPALATKVSELVDSINATYGSLEFQPVHHYHQTIERDEYFALLTVADVALITSIRDGMNTTAMEYIICQQKAKGMLIVSEFNGVAANLNRALKVNPWDLGGVARAINECLLMPMGEKSSRHAQLYEMVKQQTAAVWAATNLLKLLESLQGEQATQNTPALDEDLLIEKYRSATKRLLLFDYDGTLTPIVKTPSAAVPSESLLESLAIITADPKNVVYIISGRDGEFLDQHLGHLNVGMSAEHGCYLRGPGMKDWISLTNLDDEEPSLDWRKDVLSIFRYYEERTMGSFVEVKKSSVTFHYRNADPVFGLFQAKECQAMLESMQESLPIDVMVGKKNVEVRPAHTNKGEIVQRLLYTYPDTEFCMCAGDDKTDEDMFHAISRVFTSCAVGQSPIIAAPESLTAFPALSKPTLNGNGNGKESVEEFLPVTTNLDLDSMFTIAIDENPARLTIARATLETPEQMILCLARMAVASKE